MAAESYTFVCLKDGFINDYRYGPFGNDNPFRKGDRITFDRIRGSTDRYIFHNKTNFFTGCCLEREWRDRLVAEGFIKLEKGNQQK